MAGGITISGADVVKRALRELEPKLARKVIRNAQRAALAPIKTAIQSALPVKSGRLRKSVRIRSSKGPRGSGRKTISSALLVGSGGANAGDKAKGIVRPWWAWLIERGWTTGRRIRSGGKVVGRVGKTTKVQGKFIVQRMMRSHETTAMRSIIDAIRAGVEGLAGR